jgi:hypothetical protein
LVLRVDWIGRAVRGRCRGSMLDEASANFLRRRTG